MQGWVIVVMPGGNIYDMFDEDDAPIKKSSFRKRVLRRGVKTILTFVQLYWWLKT